MRTALACCLTPAGHSTSPHFPHPLPRAAASARAPHPMPAPSESRGESPADSLLSGAGKRGGCAGARGSGQGMTQTTASTPQATLASSRCAALYWALDNLDKVIYSCTRIVSLQNTPNPSHRRTLEILPALAMNARAGARFGDAFPRVKLWALQDYERVGVFYHHVYTSCTSKMVWFGVVGVDAEDTHNTYT